MHMESGRGLGVRRALLVIHFFLPSKGLNSAYSIERLHSGINHTPPQEKVLLKRQAWLFTLYVHTTKIIHSYFNLMTMDFMTPFNIN